MCGCDIHTSILKPRKYNSIPCVTCAVWCMTSSYLKASVFVCSKEKDESTFSQISTLSIAFKNLYFWCPKTLYMCGRKAKTEKNVFKNIQIHVDRAWMITLPQGLAQVDQKHTLFCQQSLLGWNYQTIWIHSNQLLIKLILIPFQLQNLPIYTRNRLDAFCCVNGLSYSSHLLRN